MTRAMLLVVIVMALILNMAGGVTGFVIAAALGSGVMAASSSPATRFGRSSTVRCAASCGSLFRCS